MTMKARSGAKARRVRIPEAMRTKIRVLVAEDPQRTGPDVEAELHRLVAAGELKGPVPELRTIQLYMRAARPRAPGEPWSLVDERKPAIPARPVLESLGGAIRQTGRPIVLSVKEATRIAMLADAAPWLYPYQRYVLARRYVAAIDNDQPTAPIDRDVSLLRDAPAEFTDTIDSAVQQLYQDPERMAARAAREDSDGQA